MAKGSIVTVESIFKAVKRSDDNVVVHFKIAGAGQDAVINARKAFPGHRLILRGWSIVTDGVEKVKAVDLSSEYVIKGN